MNPPAPKRILNIALLACLIGTSPLATTQLASAGINPDGTYTVESGDYLYRISRVTAGRVAGRRSSPSTRVWSMR